MRNIKKFSVQDDIIDADVELTNLLDLVFKHARGFDHLVVEVQVRDSSCLRCVSASVAKPMHMIRRELGRSRSITWTHWTHWPMCRRP